MTLLGGIVIGAFLGGTLGFLVACLFAAKGVSRARREGYREGMGDGLVAAQDAGLDEFREAQQILERFAAAQGEQ